MGQEINMDIREKEKERGGDWQNGVKRLMREEEETGEKGMLAGFV